MEPFMQKFLKPMPAYEDSREVLVIDLSFLCHRRVCLLPTASSKSPTVSAQVIQAESPHAAGVSRMSGARNTAPDLRIQEVQDVPFILRAERSPHAHVPNNRPGDMRRECFRCVVTTAAILCELALSCSLLNCRWLLVLVRSCRAGRLWVCAAGIHE